MNIQARNGRYDLSGPVDYTTAVQAREDVEKLIDAQEGTLVLGLSEATEGSTIMVALMMGWVRYARRADRTIEFKDLPPKLAQLLDFTGLDAVLPIGKAGS
jgi:anti-anti-sigma regulatory factor